MWWWNPIPHGSLCLICIIFLWLIKKVPHASSNTSYPSNLSNRQLQRRTTTVTITFQSNIREISLYNLAQDHYTLTSENVEVVHFMPFSVWCKAWSTCATQLQNKPSPRDGARRGNCFVQHEQRKLWKSHCLKHWSWALVNIVSCMSNMTTRNPTNNIAAYASHQRTTRRSINWRTCKKVTESNCKFCFRAWMLEQGTWMLCGWLTVRHACVASIQFEMRRGCWCMSCKKSRSKQHHLTQVRE